MLVLTKCAPMQNLHVHPLFYNGSAELMRQHVVDNALPLHKYYQVYSIMGPLLLLISVFSIQFSEGRKISLYYADDILFYEHIVVLITLAAIYDL